MVNPSNGLFLSKILSSPLPFLFSSKSSESLFLSITVHFRLIWQCSFRCFGFEVVRSIALGLQLI